MRSWPCRVCAVGRAASIRETDTPTVKTPDDPGASIARVLCTADGSGLIRQDTARSRCARRMRRRTAPSRFPTGRSCSTAPYCPSAAARRRWVWLFAPDVTDDALNDPASYTAASGKPAVLTVGDVNGDGVINAQDALAIRTACAGETTPAANVLLAMDADLNGRVDAQDVRAVADTALYRAHGAARSAGGRNMKSFRTKKNLAIALSVLLVAAIVVLCIALRQKSDADVDPTLTLVCARRRMPTVCAQSMWS